MSTRRVPLSNNPNVANSPLRAASAGLNGIKKARTHAESLREEPYGQPPPAKRQMVERGVASPGSRRHAIDRGAATTTRTIVHRSASRAVGATATAATHRTSHVAAPYKPTAEEMVSLRTWHTQIRSRFPKMVFYFESVSDEQQSKLAKQVGKLGAREEKFFSIDITHVVTTRPIPPEKKDGHEDGPDAQAENEQPRTIDPALLNRTADPTRRKLIFDTTRKQKPRNADVLNRARDMGKKIWSLEKLNKILEIALPSDPYPNSTLASGRAGSQATGKAGKNLAMLLERERVNGPSDRDPTVSNQDTYNFRGPYIYIYDVEERTKPVMIREYAKAADAKDGDWPQFRISSQGRCPFVMDDNYDAPEKETRDRERARAKARAAAKAAAATAAAEEAVEPAPPQPQEADIPPPKAIPEKRTLSQMEDGHNRGVVPDRTTLSFDRSKVSNPPSLDFRSQNAFISHAKAGRFLAGEPVASGLQPSNVTSAIRSQMISSTTGGVLGAKAGTSKEIHGLQRKVVLQKAAPPVLSQDLSSRRMAEMSHDSNVFGRSASFSHATHRKLDAVDEEEASRQREKLRRTASVPVSQPKPKRDPKPGYCENCQDKFEDFDEHIVSRKHRKFAENDDNWSQLDALLSQLKRVPRY
ncbi:Dfp1/Him1, central region-domain-containing protein [Staphylotrichum tortipilum]|uniref:Dfp1/Him1, central region-domain-containing protein n=1 Tax=Staphylotrichum tortipilum TaxID=2831512 RepID=A0AAN6MGI7_9PEZI|nr:Dfp1/Him1, central region-domain-containing protein [Staphylotrichum longicolle]